MGIPGEKDESDGEFFAPNYIIRTFMVPIQLSLFHHRFSLMIHVEQMNEVFFFLIVRNIKKKEIGLQS